MSIKSMMLADLAPILSDWDDVTWDAVVYKGIFHNEYEAAVLYAGEIESKNPFVEMRDVDVPDLVHDDLLTIEGLNYRVIGIQPDGMGMTIVKLNKEPIPGAPGTGLGGGPLGGGPLGGSI
jgi:hypothetical protein